MTDEPPRDGACRRLLRPLGVCRGTLIVAGTVLGLCAAIWLRGWAQGRPPPLWGLSWQSGVRIPLVLSLTVGNEHPVFERGGVMERGCRRFPAAHRAIWVFPFS